MAKKVMATICALLLVLAFSASTMAEETGFLITPFYAYTQSVMAGLSVSSGTATCSGDASASSTSNKVSITVTLQRLSSGKWTAVQSWSSSGTGYASVSKTKALTKGYQYRVVTSGKITDSKGSLLESVSATSKTCTY